MFRGKQVRHLCFRFTQNGIARIDSIRHLLIGANVRIKRFTVLLFMVLAFIIDNICHRKAVYNLRNAIKQLVSKFFLLCDLFTFSFFLMKLTALLVGKRKENKSCNHNRQNNKDKHGSSSRFLHTSVNGFRLNNANKYPV